MQTILFLWIERFLALFTTKIVTVSENLKKELLDLKIARPDKFTAIPLGLELRMVPGEEAIERSALSGAWCRSRIIKCFWM
jgi:hypothetical protein